MVVSEVAFALGMVDGKVMWRARATATIRQPTGLWEVLVPSAAADAGLDPEELVGTGVTMTEAADLLARFVADYDARHPEA